MVVLDAVLKEQVGAFFRGFPPRSDAAGGRFAGEVGELAKGAFENVLLLLEGHGIWVLVGVAVKPNLQPRSRTMQGCQLKKSYECRQG